MNIGPKSETGSTPSELKPSFSLRYLTFFVITALIGTIITVAVPKFISRMTDQPDTKKLLLTILPAQNLAALPENITSKLEFSVLIGPNERKILKSLYGYQVSLVNHSERTPADNIDVFIKAPPNVEFIEPPTIVTPSNLLRLSTLASQKFVDGGGVEFVIDQLEPGASIAFSYTGYSHELLSEATWPQAEARAKGWSVSTFAGDAVESGVLYTQDTYGYGYADGYDPTRAPTFASKRLSEYDVLDAVTLLLVILTVTGVIVGLAWLLMSVPYRRLLIRK